MMVKGREKSQLAVLVKHQREQKQWYGGYGSSWL